MLPLSLLLLGSPPATAEDPQDPPPAITEVYRVPDAEAPSGEVRLVQVGSEEDPRSTLLVETGAGLQVVEVGLDGAHATPLGLTTSPRPGKGLRRVDDLYWFGGSLAAVVRGSGQVYSRSAGEPASPPLALGLRGLEQVFFLDQYVIGVRGTRIASLDLADGSTARRDEPALKEANRLCVDPTHGFAIYGVGTLYLDPGSLAPAEDNGLGRFWQEDCWPRPSQFRRELPSTLTSGGLVTGEVQEDHLEVALRSGDETTPLWRLPGVVAAQRIGPHLLVVLEGGRAVGWWRDFARAAARRARPLGTCAAGDCVDGVGALTLKSGGALVGAFQGGLLHGLAARLEAGGRMSDMGVWEEGRYLTSLPDGLLVDVVMPGPDGIEVRGGIDRYGNRSGAWLTSRSGSVEEAEVYREGGRLGTCASPDHCQGPRGEIRGAEWRYEGALRHGLPHGQGRWTWTASDRRFEGTFEEGFPVSGEDWGLGRLLFKGSVRKDFTHDSGRTPLPDGSGTWIGPHDERGLPHGRGSFENRQGRVLTAVAEHGAISRPD